MYWVSLKEYCYCEIDILLVGSSNNYRHGQGKWALKYTSYRKGKGLKKPVQVLLSASCAKLTNGRGFKEIEHFQNYLSDYKLLSMMVEALIGSFSVEIPFRRRYCTFYTMLDTWLWLQTWKLQWKRGTKVTRVKHCTAIHATVTELAPYVQLHPLF